METELRKKEQEIEIGRETLNRVKEAKEELELLLCKSQNKVKAANIQKLKVSSSLFACDLPWLTFCAVKGPNRFDGRENE